MAPKYFQKTSVIQCTELRKTQKIIIHKQQIEKQRIIIQRHGDEIPMELFESQTSFRDNESPSSQGANEAQFIDCPICAEKTLNQYHYGGIACDSCKAFFRRTAVSPSKKSQKCRTGHGSCHLKMERRNNCPFCRFQECLKNGMDPNLIKIKTTSKAINVKKPLILNCEPVAAPTVSYSNEDSLLDDKLSQVLRYHKLVMSQTSGVNLMTVPDKFINLIHRNIANARDDNETNGDILTIAEIEHSFLSVKSEFIHELREKYPNFSEATADPAQLFLKVQELLLEMIVRFMKGCNYFQALTWDCKGRLLRKNITDIIIILLTMAYEKQNQTLKFNLSNTVIELNQQSLSAYLSDSMAHDLFEFVGNFSQLEIPGHVLIILIIICLYSRDGMLMKKQEKIDTARNYYQQLLFRYTRETSPEDQSTRLNATLHRALKTVKDFSENIRAFPILNFQTKINV